MREGITVQHDPSSKKDGPEQVFLPDELSHDHALEDLGQLTASVVHDVNNQLTAILCAAPLLARAVAGNEAAALLTEEIRAAAERAAELTRRALSVVRRGSPR
jgi:signal transduction histidine kinase